MKVLHTLPSYERPQYVIPMLTEVLRRPAYHSPRTPPGDIGGDLFCPALHPDYVLALALCAP